MEIRIQGRIDGLVLAACDLERGCSSISITTLKITQTTLPATDTILAVLHPTHTAITTPFLQYTTTVPRSLRRVSASSEA